MNIHELDWTWVVKNASSNHHDDENKQETTPTCGIEKAYNLCLEAVYWATIHDERL